MSLNQQSSDPTKRWAEQLRDLGFGSYRYLPKEDAIQLADGRKRPWEAVKAQLQKLSSGGQSSGGSPAQAQATSSRPEESGTRRASLTAGPRGQSSIASSATLTIRSGNRPATASASASATATASTVTRYTFKDDATGQQSTTETGEARELTPLDLQSSNIYATRRIVESRNSSSRVQTKYKVQPPAQRAFRVGNVIELLHTEQSTENSAITPTGEYAGATRMRRFVIIEERNGYSAALPITTYGGQGVARYGVRRSDHIVIYTGDAPPAPNANEGPVRLPTGEIDTLRPGAIQVIPLVLGTRLDRMSRLNLNEQYIIDHRVEVHVFGYVATDSMRLLTYGPRDVGAAPSQSTRSGPETRPSAGYSQTATSSQGTMQTQSQRQRSDSRYASQQHKQGQGRDSDDSDDSDDAEVSDSGSSGAGSDDREQAVVVELARNYGAIRDGTRRRAFLDGLQRSRPNAHRRLVEYLRHATSQIQR